MNDCKYTGFLVRSQLEKFYRERGHSGHCLSRLVERDLRRVEANSPTSLVKGYSLADAFNWAYSPEGDRYWRARYNPAFY